LASVALLAGAQAHAQEAIVFSAQQVESGQTLYQATCQICHGNRLSNGQFGTPLRGSYFRNNWKGKSLGELVQHTWEKMPPDNVQSLSPEQVAQVLAFILSRNDIAAGDTAMSTDMDTVNGIPLPW
jgi:mono/diheme cytochrome c family protein